MKRFALMFVFSVLAGCTMFAPDERTAPPTQLPDKYSLEVQGTFDSGRWWKSFNSTDLDRLVETALRNNFDLRATYALVEQAYATARKTNAALYPSLDGEANANQERTYKQSTSRGNHKYSETEGYYLGLAAAYEVDLWGRLRSESEVDRLEAQATREDYESAAMTLAASVAEAWADLLAIRQEKSILQEQVKTNETILHLQELRFANGLANALDVSQQREVVAESLAELVPLEAQEKLYLNSLALLLGSTSPDSVQVKQQTVPRPPPLPATGIPANLLEMRPDVRAAQLRVSSADWGVSAARADRLPNLVLSADAAFSSAQFTTILTNWMTNIAGGVTAPIFDGGQRAAEVDRTRAVVSQNLADYAETVATAVKEVQDALINETHQERYIELLEDQLRVARISLYEARQRYLKGLSDYLTYISELTSVQSLERQIVEEKGTLLTDRVDLHRALGGSWTNQLHPLANATKQTSPHGDTSLQGS
jgi:NodT family efflux transporter outer membrane factor (OMF) lipoprotein